MRWEEATVMRVSGEIPGTDPQLAGQVLVVFAYYDSASVVPALSPGAESACGMATLLETAKYLSENPPRRKVKFIAAPGHFQALSGARDYALKTIYPRHNGVDKTAAAGHGRAVLLHRPGPLQPAQQPGLVLQGQLLRPAQHHRRQQRGGAPARLQRVLRRAGGLDGPPDGQGRARPDAGLPERHRPAAGPRLAFAAAGPGGLRQRDRHLLRLPGHDPGHHRRPAQQREHAAGHLRGHEAVP